MKRELSILFTLMLAIQVLAGSAAAETIYVDDDGPGNYTTIQAALDDAVDGDTIIVSPGTYDEYLTVDVPVTIKGSSGYPSVGKIEVYQQSQISGLTITEGVHFDQAGVSCIIRNNKFDECGVSIGINNAYGNQTIMNNFFTDSPVGVSTYDSINNKIIGNTFQNCYTGVALTYGAGGHVVTGNTFQDCDTGILLDDDSATIYDNYFSSDVNLELEYDGSARLNTTKTEGKNIIDGPYIGGNFWGSPSGDGFSQTHLDADGDGIAEEAYQVDKAVIDYLPLVTPRIEPEPVYPVANFRTNTTLGHAPLSVLFTDLSENATGWSWDFDGNGQPESTVRSPVYVYQEPGAYTVNLTVSNSNGTASSTAVITVLEEVIPILPVAAFSTNVTGGYYPLAVLFTDLSENATGWSWDVNGDGIEDSNAASFVYVYTSKGTYEAKLIVSNANGTDTENATMYVEKKRSGGSSGGGGGGGGGGSPEPAKNVKVKELSQVFITNGREVKFDFTKNATCVVYVSFDAKKNAGKTTTIVEELKGKSSLVSSLPAGEVYKSFNVWVGNSGYATSKNIENPVVCFKVEKTWMEDENVDQASIALNRYSDNKWEQLPARISGKDNTYLYFTSEVPGFSSFTITGISKAASESVTENGTSLKTRSPQDDGNESTAQDTDGEQDGNTKSQGLPSVYGAIGIIFLGLICAIIYLKLP